MNYVSHRCKDTIHHFFAFFVCLFVWAGNMLKEAAKLWQVVRADNVGRKSGDCD